MDQQVGSRLEATVCLTQAEGVVVVVAVEVVTGTASRTVGEVVSLVVVSSIASVNTEKEG